MLLKPQDFLVALKLVAWGEQRWTYALLAQELGLSASEVHSAVKRGLQAGLLMSNGEIIPVTLKGAQQLDKWLAMPGQTDATNYRPVRKRKRVLQENEVADNPIIANLHNLSEFAVCGAKYAFFAERTQLTIGVPTSHSAPAFAGVFAPGSIDFVWPHPNGLTRGVGITPLHACVPFAAMRDAKLYEMLALFDALRVGRARERGMALERLPQLIHPKKIRNIDSDANG